MLKLQCHSIVHVHRICWLLAGVDSLKEPNAHHLPSERYSPVRRASDGVFGLAMPRHHHMHLEKLYNQALAQSPSLKQVNRENEELQVRENR